jgi:hypothetical protein
VTPDLLPPRIGRRIIVSPEGCWEWCGARTSNGYGSAGHSKRVHSTHRLAYTLLVGEVPDGLHLDHLCRVRHCCNPAHLEPVTPAENQRRSPLTEHNRTHCPKGHPYDQVNTYLKRGARQCRECRKAYLRAYRARKATS